MFNLLKKHKKILLSLCLIILISCFAIFFQAKTVKADLISNFFGAETMGDLVISIFSHILYIFFRFFSVLLSISGFLLDWAFGLNKFIKVPIVQTGWRITRDMANMFFVLILLFIAFATILRLETYGMKSILPKLIIAALLINFSLIFCGIIIDATQITTKFFLDPFEQGGASLSERVADGLNISRIFEKDAEAAGLDALNILIGLIGGVIVILVMFFVMAAAALFLIVRVVALWFLIILAPIVWLLWILPDTVKFWQRWWSSFLKWALFAPSYAFFFYLALTTVTGASGQGGFLSNIYSTIPLGKNEGFISAFLSSQTFIIQYIFLILLLLAGLIVAQQLGVHGASGAMNIAKRTGKGTASWVGRRAMVWGVRPAAEATQKGLAKAGAKLEARGGLYKPLAWTTEKLAQVPLAISEKERAAFGTSEAKYKNWTSDHLKLQYKAADPRDKAAIGKVLAERGDLEADAKLSFTETDIKNSAKIAQKYAQHSPIIKARVDLAPLTKKKEDDDDVAIQKVLSKMKEADIAKIESISFGKLKVDKETGKVKPEFEKREENQITAWDEFKKQLQQGGRLKATHLAKMATENGTLFEMIQKMIIEKPEELRKIRDDIKEYIKSNPGKALFGKPFPDEEYKTTETEAEARYRRETSYGG